MPRDLSRSNHLEQNRGRAQASALVFHGGFVQHRARDNGRVCTEKLQGHQRTGAVREDICRGADMLDNGLQVGGLGGEVVAPVRGIAALAATAAVVGNYAIAAGELAGDPVKNVPSTQAPCTHTKAGASDGTPGSANSRQAIVVPAFSTVKSMLCPIALHLVNALTVPNREPLIARTSRAA
mgnify:CR=1 FL=1